MTDYWTPLIYILLQVIVFAFREFAILGDNSKCQSAVLRYYDGENVGRAPQEFCGTELPSVTRSSGNVVVFELYLTGDCSWSGFRVDYTAVHNASDSRYPVIGIGKIWEGFTRSMRSMHVDKLYNNHSRYCFSRQWINTLITNALPDNDLMGGCCAHDDVIKWKHFLFHWPSVRGIHRFPAQWPVTRSFDVFFISARMNG